MPRKTFRTLLLVVFVWLIQLEMDVVIAECNSTFVQSNFEKCFETHNTDPANPTICGSPDNVTSCVDNSIVTCSDPEVGLWRKAISRYNANLLQLCASGSTQNFCNDEELLSGYDACLLSMGNNTCSSYRAAENCCYWVISNCSLSSPVLVSHPYLILLGYSVELICESTDTGPCGFKSYASCNMVMPQNASMETTCMIMIQTAVCLEAFLGMCPDTTYITQEAINLIFSNFNLLCSSGCNVTQLFVGLEKCGNPGDVSSMTCDELIVGLGCIEGALALTNCSVEIVDAMGLVGPARAYLAANCTDGTTETITNANNAEGTTELVTNGNNAEAPKLYIRLVGLVVVIAMAFL